VDEDRKDPCQLKEVPKGSMGFLKNPLSFGTKGVLP
jgi:hypothetical protein